MSIDRMFHNFDVLAQSEVKPTGRPVIYLADKVLYLHPPSCSAKNDECSLQTFLSGQFLIDFHEFGTKHPLLFTVKQIQEVDQSETAKKVRRVFIWAGIKLDSYLPLLPMVACSRETINQNISKHSNVWTNLNCRLSFAEFVRTIDPLISGCSFKNPTIQTFLDLVSILDLLGHTRDRAKCLFVLASRIFHESKNRDRAVQWAEVSIFKKFVTPVDLEKDSVVSYGRYFWNRVSYSKAESDEFAAVLEDKLWSRESKFTEFYQKNGFRLIQLACKCELLLKEFDQCDLIILYYLSHATGSDHTKFNEGMDLFTRSELMGNILVNYLLTSDEPGESVREMILRGENFERDIVLNPTILSDVIIDECRDDIFLIEIMEKKNELCKFLK